MVERCNWFGPNIFKKLLADMVVFPHPEIQRWGLESDSNPEIVELWLESDTSGLGIDLRHADSDLTQDLDSDLDSDLRHADSDLTWTRTWTQTRDMRTWTRENVDSLQLCRNLRNSSFKNTLEKWKITFTLIFGASLGLQPGVAIPSPSYAIPMPLFLVIQSQAWFIYSIDHCCET